MHAVRIARFQFKGDAAVRAGADACAAPDAQLRFKKDELFHDWVCLKAA